jgi:hypothetical protein
MEEITESLKSVKNDDKKKQVLNLISRIIRRFIPAQNVLEFVEELRKEFVEKRYKKIQKMRN